MFRRQNNKSKSIFKLYNEDLQLFDNYEVLSLPLAKQSIKDKSRDIYGDPNPCFIHESAVRLRMILELEEYLKEWNEPVAISRLPEQLKTYISEELTGKYILVITKNS